VQASDPSDERAVHLFAFHLLKEEIDSLTKQQSEVLLTATYLGITPEETKEYYSRRDEILELVQQLRQLEKGI
jgi:hypothetical protein